MRPKLAAILATGCLLSGCYAPPDSVPYAAYDDGVYAAPGYAYSGPAYGYGYQPYYAAPYGPGWYGGRREDHDWQRREWHGDEAGRGNLGPQAHIQLPAAPPPSPRPSTPQVQRNQQLLDQLGFRPNR
jgi:hypothetical protein